MYNYPDAGVAAQYNGNISEIKYTGHYSESRWFKYSYDHLNRLTGSLYSTLGRLNEEVSYDRGGNITSLKRGPPASAATVYSYGSGGQSNRLSGTSGAVSGVYL